MKLGALQKWQNLLWATLVATPHVAIIVQVRLWGVNIPYWDEWELVPILDKSREGTLAFSDLWAQHNEHRLLFPKALMLGLAAASRWDIRWELYASVVFAGVTFLALYSLLPRSIQALKVMLLFSLLLFSPIQWENWSWGWQVAWYLTVCSAVLAIWGLIRAPGRWIGLAGAVLAGTVSSYSMASGLLVWPIGVLLLFGSSRWTVQQRGAWILGAGVITAVYFIDYKMPSYHPALAIGDPWGLLRYAFAYLGAPIAGWRVLEASIVGLGGFLTYCAITRMLWKELKDREAEWAWHALGLFAIGNALMTGIARLGFGLEQALSSRYTTIASMFWIALIGISAIAWQRSRVDCKGRVWRNTAQRVGLVLLLGIFFTAYAASYSKGVNAFRARGIALERGRKCVLVYASAPSECLSAMYPNADKVRNRAAILERLGLGPFRSAR